MKMQSIVLVMGREPIAQCFINRLGNRPDISATHLQDYGAAASAARGAGAALIEAGESGEHDTAYCLALCGRLRAAAPHCRLMLMCPERDTSGVAQAVAAKKEGQIDDFVFYEASLDYLISKMISML